MTCSIKPPGVRVREVPSFLKTGGGATLPIGPLIIKDNVSHSLKCLDCTKGKTTHSCIIASEGLGKLRISKLLVSIAGWLIIAFAIFIGAPFWFEILGRLVQVGSIDKSSKEI